MTLTWVRWREDDPDRRKSLPPGWPETSPTRLIERCQASPLVLDVVVEPVEECGNWYARFRHCGESRKGRAESVELARQAALDAGEQMLTEALLGVIAARAAGVTSVASEEVAG